ncbi:MAG: bifunctional phosphoglucose/phosphomannose isomerase [Candidatus Vogelbacteria bacterium]|nr:bifunctional phosphoglucose/phosphomannose isomerase [Candidatus Vogelbacteria bacterium]
MIENNIKDFNKQFGFRPKTDNINNLKVLSDIVVGGMGGSHLSADLLKIFRPDLNLRVHSDYGLPAFVRGSETLFIASSYSGNTEETLNFAEEVISGNLPLAVVASGGKLLEMAKIHNLLYIVLPSGLQPRMAVGYSFVAFVTMLGEKELLTEVYDLENTLRPEMLEEKGRDLAKKLSRKISLIYSSRDNFPLAYIWKIKLNELGKMPAFCNFLPELDHNEIVGFDNLGAVERLKDDFHIIFLKSGDEHPRILKRMELTKKLLDARLPDVSIIELDGKSKLEKIFNSIILVDWISFHVAKLNGADPERVNIIEDLKRELA